jgi:dihydrofolate reductase
MQMANLKFSVIAAVSSNGVIGNRGDIPWHIKEDMHYFRELTTSNTNGNVVIMGRKTWQSLPNRFKPLKDRINIVVTSSTESYEIRDKNAYAQPSLIDALELGNSLVEDGTLYVIGGQSLYQEAIGSLWENLDRLYLTHVNGFYRGDSFFPYVDLNNGWDLVFATSADIASGEVSCAWSVYQPKQP